MDPAEVEHLTGEKPKSTSAADLNVLFSQIKARLSERDRQILALLEQDLGPKEIANAFNISYLAAAKAIQRARERMAAILSGTGRESNDDDKKCHDPEHLALKFDDPSPE
jgi:DNA-directed RNA polymerase specialized sigma24 family protein